MAGKFERLFRMGPPVDSVGPVAIAKWLKMVEIIIQVGVFFTPLKNMKVNLDDYSQVIWENKIHGNQTTNQL